VKALNKAERGKVGIYNVGTGKGRSVKEFVERRRSPAPSTSSSP
jgi:UDP-glucose 4-epimerase